MTDNRPAIDLGPSAKPDLSDTEELGFRAPTLPSEELTAPKRPLLKLDDPSPREPAPMPDKKPDPETDEKAKTPEKVVVKLRRNKKAPERHIAQKTYADLIQDRFIVNFSADISNYTVSPFIADCQKALCADEQSVLIHISSRGGTVDDGVRIYEQIRMLNTMKPVDILVSGYCYSACVWAVMAVPLQNRWISTNSRVMIHPVHSSGADGKVIPRDELDSHQRLQQDWLNDRWVVEEIARNSDIRRSDLRRLVDQDGQDVILSAGMAVKLGAFAGMV